MQIPRLLYPNAPSRIGLLVLRTSTTLTCGLQLLSDDFSGRPELAATCLFLVSLLMIGLITRPTSLLLAAVFVWEAALRFNGSSIFLIAAAIECLALALLGPGGWSLDARLFGRRVIEIGRRT